MSKTFSWIFIIAAIIVVFIAVNYQSGQDAVPLSEIFPDDKKAPVDVEYEFVQEEVAQVETEGETIGETAKVGGTDNSSNVFSPLKVKDQPSAQKAAPAPTINAAQKPFNFTIQIASFSDLKKAEAALATIREKVPTAYISTQNLGDKGVWHRIYAGQYELRSEAEINLTNIKRDYDSSFIISPKKAE